jgi:two-component system, sporulation sensor kinase E
MKTWVHGEGTVNILLVDDRPDNIVALEAVLTSPQYNLISALSGEEALRLVLKHDFAVILMDVQMPGMNGFEAARMIKTREQSMHIPIIFITAISKAREHVLQGYGAGAVDYIFKPFHPETLQLKVEGFVRLYKDQVQLQRQGELLWQGTLGMAERSTSPSSDLLEKQARDSEEPLLDSERSHMLSYGQTISILESITDAFYSVDTSWRFTYVNQEAERQFGMSRMELIGRSLWEMQEQPFELDKVFDSLEHSTVEQTPVHFEAHSPDGRRWFEVRAYPSEGGLAVYFSDVTKRKRMEQELERSQQYFRQIFNSSPSLISLRALDTGQFIDVNESWLRSTGYSLEEMNRDVPEVIRAVDPEEGQQGLLSAEGSINNILITYMTKQGEKRDGLLSTQLLDVYGERCLLSVITDITERRRLDQELTRLRQLNLVGEMAAGIAHEIRNPMTTVRGFLQLSKGGLKAESIELMIEELDRANSIITEFLSLAKNTISNQKLQSLNSVLMHMSPLLEAEALLVGKHVALELDACPDLLLDEKEIWQIVLNMGKNGLDAMPTGGQLTIRTFAEGEHVVLQIEDQGTGIPEELLSRIGTPFFTTKEQGTGLGLAVCYSIANRHRAVIDVQSGSIGTTFTIRFPQHSSISSGE